MARRKPKTTLGAILSLGYHSMNGLYKTAKSMSRPYNSKGKKISRSKKKKWF